MLRQDRLNPVVREDHAISEGGPYRGHRPRPGERGGNPHPAAFTLQLRPAWALILPTGVPYGRMCGSGRASGITVLMIAVASGLRRAEGAREAGSQTR